MQTLLVVDGELLFSGGADGAVMVWDIAPGVPIRRLQTLTDDSLTKIYALAYHDGHLYAGSEDQMISVW